MKLISGLILALCIAFPSHALAAGEDPCVIQFGPAWKTTEDTHLERLANEFLMMGDVALKVRICKSEWVGIGGIIAQAGLQDINGEKHILIGVDTRFQRLAGSHMRPIIAHEVAHFARAENTTCPLLLAGKMIDMFIDCEYRVDVLSAEWTSLRETIEALTFAADYADTVDRAPKSSEALRIRIRMLKERE
jgi:hypothetical protein